jgi:hypothetical protein
MSLLVTGSIGIDTVRTPFGYNKDCVGGSAVHFTMGAGLFTEVKFLGVAGEDFNFDLKELFGDRKVDLKGLEIRKGSKTFRWSGSYEGDMNSAHTDAVELNVLTENPPQMPEGFRDCGYVFLANTAPSLQIQLLDQLNNPSFVAADTMNHWIITANEDLRELLRRIDMLVLNEGEAKLLTGQRNLVTAAKSILDMGPQVVIIKKGEHGSMMYNANGDSFLLPAYPAAIVIDPTGAGDSFAGGVMGYLASVGRVDVVSLRNAMVYGTVVASFTIGDFSVYGIKSATRQAIDERFDQLRKVTQF